MKPQGHGFDPWSGNQIPQAATKDSACCNKDPAQPNQLVSQKKKKKTHTQWKKRNKAIFKKIEKNIPYTRHAKLLAKYQQIEFRTSQKNKTLNLIMMLISWDWEVLKTVKGTYMIGLGVFNKLP